MNALILSAIFGVIMLFSGIWLKQKAIVRAIAVIGMIVLLLANIMEIYSPSFFPVNIAGMMYFDRFALLFNSIAIFSTLVFFILSARDMEKTGIHYAEYFALIFLCYMKS